MPDRIHNYEKQNWFCEVAYKKITGSPPRFPWGSKLTDDQESNLEQAWVFTRNFCGLAEEEVERILLSRSTLDLARYSIKVKGERLVPSVEREFLEKCKGKKSRINALLSYCGHWEIMPENMTEITMVAGFEGGRRGRIGSEFMKKLAENKRRCKDLLTQIMKLEGISEEEPISKIMARLG
jgi:hypothetical protein